MLRTRYLTIENNATTSDASGNYYPDPFTFPIHNFRYNYPTFKVLLSDIAIKRFDLLVYSYYGTPDYTDLVLFLNGVGFKEDLEIEQELIFPDLRDIENFYATWRI